MHKKIFVILLAILCIKSIQAQAPSGFYVGEVCEISEANILYYNTPLKIQVGKPLKFKGGHIHSSNNRNDLHRIALEVEKVPENTWLVLKIDESYYATCLRSKKRKRRYAHGESSKPILDDQDKVTSDTSNSKGGFVIEKREDAERISKFLEIDIVDRKHFGHKLAGELKVRKKTYALGDSILLDFTLANEGQVPVQLRWDDWQKGSTSTLNRFQFKVTHNGKKLKNKKKKAANSTYFSSGPVPSNQLLATGENLERTINLTEWFDFDEVGEYLISWNYKMQLRNGRKGYDSKRAPEFVWDDELGGRFVLFLE